MADIFQEVEEELRRDNLIKLWRRYAWYIIGAAVAIVVGTAAYVGWRQFEASRHLERARQYAAAIDLIGQTDHTAALQAFSAVAGGSDGFAALARLQQARLLAKGGDGAAAIAVYDQMATDDRLQQPYRDLALILLAINDLDKGDATTLIERLAPLTADDNPWRFTALEITGLLATRAGQMARARDIFVHLSDDLNAPPGVRERATELLASLPS